jgi:hypothetical protein
MSKTLCTFSGKFGDILWSLPTVRELSRKHNEKVDMGIMPSYRSLLPLLQQQEYIDTAFVNEPWACEGSPYGDQPAIPQNDEALRYQYENVYHLTYRHHPAPNQPLVDFIASQQGIVLPEPVCPFISTGAAIFPAHANEADNQYWDLILTKAGRWKNKPEDFIAYSFNELYADQKGAFLNTLRSLLPDEQFIETNKLSWRMATFVIKSAKAFVGCRSSQYVLASGVGQANIFLYEPHPARHHQGQFGSTFSNTHWPEASPVYGTPPEEAAKQCALFFGQHGLNRKLEKESVCQ